jgi:hypothetical protein
MPIYEFTHDAIVPVEHVNLASQGIWERRDLQRVLRANLAAVISDTYVLAEEYSEWEDSKRSIDLLGLDKGANLVVIELKRTQDGGHMELQSIRYAAMVSKMTFAQAVDAHSNFLAKFGGNPDEAESAILKFLDWDEPREKEFAQDIRIVLVSADFSKEITTSVLWLNERELDIRCVRLRPYRLGEKTLLDIQQVLPLPEAAAYEVQLRRKAAEERQERGSDWTKYDLRVEDSTLVNLSKRHLFLHVLRALIEKGVSVNDLMEHLPARKFLGLPNKLTAAEFRREAVQSKKASGGPFDLSRFFIQDGELFFSDDRTWALSNQWSRHQLPALDALIAKYPAIKLSYTKHAGAGEE